MEIQQVRSFLAVARHGSFRRAAREIHRTQPAVTMAVQALEAELGVRLFERAGRRTRPSPAGELLLAAAGPLLRDWEGLGDRVRESLTGAPAGTLRVGAGEAAILYLLPEVVQRYRKRFPGVALTLRHLNDEETVAELEAGSLDLGIRALESPPTGYRFEPVVETDRVVITPRRHPLGWSRRLTLKDLAPHPFVLPWRASVSRALLEQAMSREGLSLRIALEGGRWEMLKRYVATGLGIAVVPEICLSAGDRRALEVHPAAHLFGREQYGILLRSGRVTTRAAREFAEAFRRRWMPQAGSPSEKRRRSRARSRSRS